MVGYEVLMFVVGTLILGLRLFSPSRGPRLLDAGENLMRLQLSLGPSLGNNTDPL